MRIEQLKRIRLYKSAIDYVGCALFFCYIFARYSSLKPILIYAKLYVSCVLKGEYYLYLCNTTNHTKNASNVVFSPQKPLNKHLKEFQLKSNCRQQINQSPSTTHKNHLKDISFYIKEKYNRSQTTLFSKAFLMLPGSFTITYDPILTRSFPTSQPSKAPSEIEIKANLSIKQILFYPFHVPILLFFETFSNANSRIFHSFTSNNIALSK